jgi:hypothetical protein
MIWGQPNQLWGQILFLQFKARRNSSSSSQLSQAQIGEQAARTWIRPDMPCANSRIYSTCACTHVYKCIYIIIVICIYIYAYTVLYTPNGLGQTWGANAPTIWASVPDPRSWHVQAEAPFSLAMPKMHCRSHAGENRVAVLTQARSTVCCTPSSRLALGCYTRDY